MAPSLPPPPNARDPRPSALARRRRGTAPHAGRRRSGTRACASPASSSGAFSPSPRSSTASGSGSSPRASPTISSSRSIPSTKCGRPLGPSRKQTSTCRPGSSSCVSAAPASAASVGTPARIVTQSGGPCCCEAGSASSLFTSAMVFPSSRRKRANSCGSAPVFVNSIVVQPGRAVSGMTYAYSSARTSTTFCSCSVPPQPARAAVAASVASQSFFIASLLRSLSVGTRSSAPQPGASVARAICTQSRERSPDRLCER